MVATSFIVATVCAVLMLCNTQQISNYVNVTTSLGTVTGLRVVTGSIEYCSFRGIPYANATRFKASKAMQPWASLVMATFDGPPCSQPSMFGEHQESTEDCLFLNIYTPQLSNFSSPDQPKLPVMVHIHGGAFIIGSSNSYLYGPEFFMAEKKVILVTFNYRLGIFGFFSTGSEGVQGNAGLKDQVEALKFVKNQISYFGGDPNKITIFGDSAGAASVIHQVLSPMSEGLFQRAIALSGTALADWACIDSNSARDQAIAVARKLSCNTENTTTIVTCLKAMSASALSQASIDYETVQETLIQQASRPDQFILRFRPVIETSIDEDVFLADHPVNVLNNLTEVVPLIIGTNKDEGAAFLRDNDTDFAFIDKNLKYFALPEVLEQATEDQLNEFTQQVRKYYFNNNPVNRSTLQGLVNLITDRLFMYSTAQTVRKLAEKKSSVYLYHFAYNGNYTPIIFATDTQEYKGVSHGDNLGYLFYSEVFNNTNLTQTETEDYKTMQRMVKLFVAFATNGTPSSSTDEIIRNIHWPEITNASELNYLEMEANFTPAMHYYKERIALWDQLANLQRSSAFNIKPPIFLTLFLLISTIKSFRFSV